MTFEFHLPPLRSIEVTSQAQPKVVYVKLHHFLPARDQKRFLHTSLSYNRTSNFSCMNTSTLSRSLPEAWPPPYNLRTSVSTQSSHTLPKSIFNRPHRLRSSIQHHIWPESQTNYIAARLRLSHSNHPPSE